MENTNLYSNGFIITYPEGDQSLERSPLVVLRDLSDKSYTIKEGDRITDLAHFFYGDSKEWFVIADNNQDVINNVFELIPGTVIVIPNNKKIQ